MAPSQSSRATAPVRSMSAGPHEVSPVAGRLARILDGSDFPALSQQIMATISTLDDDQSSLQRLANVVLREYSLTLSVVRAANSAHYRRSGRPIQSATHAMMMLGARTVRHLASSLLLFENYHRRSAGLKELMLLSLLTANHARETAARLGRSDPEEAHLCGMFHNLGEVLVACHFPEDYARIHASIQDERQSESAAAYAVLEFRYEDLGIEVAKHWGMPDTVLQGIRASTPLAPTDAGVITAFSHDLTNAIYRRDADAGGAREALDAVIARYSSRLKLTREQVYEVVESALNETRELFASAKVSVDALRLRKLSAAARSALGVPTLGSGEWSAADAEESEDSALAGLRERLRQELEGNVDPASKTDVGGLLLLALEGALRGAPFDRVVALVLSADRTRLVARTGLGVGVELLIGQFDFAMTPRGGPLPDLLLQREPVFLPLDRPMTMTELRWAGSIGARQFGVFPIVVSGKIVGCIYGDRTAGQPAPDQAALTHVTMLCDLVVKALDARRRAAAKPSARGGSEASSLDARAKSSLVLRLLQGVEAEALARSAGVTVAQLEQWRREFLEGALARLENEAAT